MPGLEGEARADIESLSLWRFLGTLRIKERDNE